jgi:hypothetical protein
MTSSGDVNGTNGAAPRQSTIRTTRRRQAHFTFIGDDLAYVGENASAGARPFTLRLSDQYGQTASPLRGYSQPTGLVHDDAEWCTRKRRRGGGGLCGYKVNFLTRLPEAIEILQEE